MSQELLSLSQDLKRLRDEGYFIQIRGGVLLVREVPYVNAQRQVKRGTLISALDMAGNQTRKPGTHVAQFAGERPCDSDGNYLDNIYNSAINQDYGNGIVAKHQFSSKPPGPNGYTDYYQKMTTYASLLSGPATTLQTDVTCRVFKVPDEEEKSVFNYTETASARVGISAVNAKLADEKVAIVGLGGTGSYVLDLVAKTPVQEIRLFDGDEFLQHNAFRSPGAPSIEQLRDAPKKVDYWNAIYSKMRMGIQANPVHITESNLHLLDGITFAFLCLDKGLIKKPIIIKLEDIGASFVDTGMGLNLASGALVGQLRLTSSTPDRREHVYAPGRISFEDDPNEDIYTSNIQVAELNSMNANLAVLKWKKFRGFYHDLEQEHHCLYAIDGNQMINSEGIECNNSD